MEQAKLEDVISDLELNIRWIEDIPAHQFAGWMNVTRSMRTALHLLITKREKTGKWERHYSRPGVYADLFWWCSCCGEPTRYNDAGLFYRFCPKCGARLEPNTDE